MNYRHFSIFLFNFLLHILLSEAASNCKFPLHTNLPESIDFLNKLGNQTYETKDDAGSYSYKIGFCQTPLTEIKDETYAAVLQLNIASKQWVVIGRYNDTDIKIGNNWGLVEFGSGEKYSNHCSMNYRSAVIMVTCNSDIDKPIVRVIEENTNKISQCYYLFEIEHPKACKERPKSTVVNNSLGTGAIFMIILVSAIVIYLCGGVAIKKVFTNCEGVELIPNIDFWRRCGTLIADGTDCLCRPKQAHAEYQRYTSSMHNSNNLTINDLDPTDDDDEILALP